MSSTHEEMLSATESERSKPWVREVEKPLPNRSQGVLCPDCGGKLIRSGGCPFCPSCGWSRC